MPPPSSAPLFLAPAPLPSSINPSILPQSLRFIPQSTKLSTPHFRQTRATISQPAPFESAVPSATSAAIQSPKTQPFPATSTTPEHASATEPRKTYDVAVIGAGPAGLSLAAALSRRSVSVICLDGAIDAPWPNHYGVWRDEFQPVGLDDCATTIYPTTAVYSSNEKTLLDREYLRVDRVKLKRRLIERCIDGGALLCKAIVTGIDHVSDFASEIRFAPARSSSSNGSDSEDIEVIHEESVVGARLVVDCTGHALRFTEKEDSDRFEAPWEQAAYGIEAEVESYPYKVDEMLLMDFRDDHMNSAELKCISEARPTFLYVFPTSPQRAFFEETSVIAPKAVPFDELKTRLHRRLEHDGVKIRRVIEEELSLIPMGGSLPQRRQRVVAFGGAACLVHPATGYMVARTVRMADAVAGAIANGLSSGGDAMAVASGAWEITWSLELRRQRDFLNFGAELLGVLDMDDSRRFFDAFFALPEKLWSQFLGFGLDGPLDRVYFALYFFAIASWKIRIGLLKGIVEIGRWRLIRSVLPLWTSRFDDS